MKKILIALSLICFSSLSHAVEYTVNLIPADGSVNNVQIGTVDYTKIQGLNSLATKAKVTNAEIDDNTISTSKISGLSAYISSLISSAVSVFVPKSELPTSYHNVIINGNFSINQRSYISGQPVAANAYAHDRWKAGSSGGSYTYVEKAAGQSITMTSGSIIQVVEDKNVSSTSYVLSWKGAAKARVISASLGTTSYQVSPISFSAQIGESFSIEFSFPGALSEVQLNAGSVAAPFEQRNYTEELSLARRYYWKEVPAWIALDGYSPTAYGYVVTGSFRHPVQMRAVPSMHMPGFSTFTNLDLLNFGNITAEGFQIAAVGSGAGVRMIMGGANSPMWADAEL